MSNWITVRPTRLTRTAPVWSNDPIFDEAFNWVFGPSRRATQATEATATFNFKLNVAQDENNYYIYAVLPGANPEKLEVNVLENKVTISGEIAAASFGPQSEGAEQPKLRWLHRELPTNVTRFQRELALPVAVDAEKVQAQYQDGVLRLVVPQAAAVKPHKVAVVAGKSAQPILPETQNN